MSSIKYWDPNANGPNQGAWKYVAQGVKGDAGPKGDKGDTGEVGPQGYGIPAGGKQGEVLAKKDNNDYQYEWTNKVSPVTSVDNQIGVVDLTSRYDAKGLAAKKAKLSLMLSKAVPPQKTKELFTTSLTPPVVSITTTSTKTLTYISNPATSTLTITAAGYTAASPYPFLYVAVGRVVSITGANTGSTANNNIINSTNGFIVVSRTDTSLTLALLGTTAITFTATQLVNTTVSITLRNTSYSSDYSAGNDGYALTLAKAPICTLSGLGTNPILTDYPSTTVRRYHTDSTAFTYSGLVPKDVTNLESTDNTYYANNSTSQIDKERAPYWVEFDYYGSDFAVRFNAPYTKSSTSVDQDSSRIWVWVNGVPVTPAVVPLDTTANREHFYRVTWPNDSTTNPTYRRVRIMLHNMDFGGVEARNIDTITATDPRPYKVAFIDGSWLAGGFGGVTDTSLYLAPILGESLNADWYGCAIPGTGYANGGIDPALGAVEWGASSRTAIVDNINPDLIILLGSTNDDDFATSVGGAAAVKKKAADLYSHYATTLPGTPLIVFTRQSNMISGADAARNNTAVLEAALEAPNVILAVSPFSEGWVNSSTDNYFIGNDNHLSARGNLYYATRMYSNIIKALTTYINS
jgi:hypothetical protein